MSYAVIVPVTDLEHVKREIALQAQVEHDLTEQRRKEAIWQNWYRKIRKERKHETVK